MHICGRLPVTPFQIKIIIIIFSIFLRKLKIVFFFFFSHCLHLIILNTRDLDLKFTVFGSFFRYKCSLNYEIILVQLPNNFLNDVNKKQS